ncbi:Diphthamide biosynthesis protein 3 [Coemansia sp. RSA 2618]|nr:Diphthamide biosynthesis protein 3 [Coemansia sp. RSA 2618]
MADKQSNSPVKDSADTVNAKPTSLSVENAEANAESAAKTNAESSCTLPVTAANPELAAPANSELAASTETAAAPNATDTNPSTADSGNINYYDEIEIEDMDYDEFEEEFSYPCPCGDKFIITKIELESGESVAKCPSCSLLLKVVYDPDDFMPEDGEDFDLDTSIAVY